MWKSDKLNSLVCICLIVAVWPVLAVSSAPLLEHLGDFSFFVGTADFFSQKVFAVAGFLDYLCLFLNQLLFYPWLAALLLTALLVAVYFLSLSIFRIDKQNPSIALVPVALLLATVTGYGRHLFLLENMNVFYSSAIGFLISLCITQCIMRCNGFICKLIALSVAGIVGYLLFGVYALFGLLLFFCKTVSDSLRDRKTLVLCLVTLLIVALLPVFFNCQYFAGLHLMDFVDNKNCNVLPYILLAVVSVVLCFIPVKGYTGYALALVCLLFLCGGGKEFRTEINMHSALEKENWNKVLSLYSNYSDYCTKLNDKKYAALQKRSDKLKRQDKIKLLEDFYENDYKTPNRAMAQFRLIALMRTEDVADGLFNSLEGILDRKDESYSTRLSYVYGAEIMNNWGMFNCAYVLSESYRVHAGTNYYNLKESAKSLMLAGNYKLATKYLMVLASTGKYDKWAKQHLDYIQSGELSQAGRSRYNHELSLAVQRDDVFLQKDRVEMILMNAFVLWKQPDIENVTPQYSLSAMLWALYSQQIPEFWNAFTQYLIVNREAKMPLSFQEAAYLYAKLEQPELLQTLPFDASVVKKYQAFDRYVQKNSNLTQVEMRHYCSKEFGNTFFYFYYFVRNFI